MIGVDTVPERLAVAERWGVETIAELTSGRLADSVIDAVGMEASESVADSVLSTIKLQPDKLVAFHNALGSARRGGTVSVTGVYVGPMQMFPLGTGDLVTHTVALDEAPALYDTFQKKQDGCIKVVLQP